jgi:hypothetical protein
VSDAVQQEPARDERKKLYEIKMKLLAGLISFDEAKTQAMPFIDSLNKKGRTIARKYNRRFVETTFSSQMR